jgi:protein SCO1/2
MGRRFAVAGLAVPIVLTLFFGARAWSKAQSGFRSGVFDPPREAPDFELDGSTGSKVHLRDYRGRIVVLEFGFTFCQQICPVTLANLVQVHESLGPAAKDVQIVFVTVDPKRDTPEHLREYLTAFDATFVGATAAPSQLDAMRQAYGIISHETVSPNNESGFEHSSFIYLIDRAGMIRSLVPFGKPPDDIVHDIKLLLTP